MPSKGAPRQSRFQDPTPGCASFFSLAQLKFSPVSIFGLALIERRDVEIPLVETVELIAEPDGSPAEDFVIPEWLEERQRAKPLPATAKLHSLIETKPRWEQRLERWAAPDALRLRRFSRNTIGGTSIAQRLRSMTGSGNAT